MRAVLPFRLRDAKTGLSRALDREDRENLAIAMLRDVLKACKPMESVVVTPDPFDADLGGVDASVIRDSAPLNEALSDQVEEGLPVLIVPSDVPLVREEDVKALVGEEGDVVIAPGLRGGTNAMLLREPLPLRYGGRSFEKHLTEAEDLALDVAVHESFRFAIDIDEPRDLLELEIHGEGESRDVLLDRGVTEDTSDPP